MVESIPVTPRSTSVPDLNDPAELRRAREAAEAVVGDEQTRRFMRRIRARYARNMKSDRPAA